MTASMPKVKKIDVDENPQQVAAFEKVLMNLLARAFMEAGEV